MKPFVAIVSALLLMSSCFALSAGDVTTPAQGDSWCKNKAQNITWNASAFPGSRVMLILFADDQKVMDIADSAPNTGTYSWKPPHSLMEGRRYQVRVRALDGTVKPFSGYFQLKNCGVIAANDPTRSIGEAQLDDNITPGGVSAALLQMVDFEMLDVVRETGSGVIFAKLRNKGGRAYNGPLTFLVLFGNDMLDPITVPVDLAAGATGMVNLMYYLSPLDLAMRNSVLVKVVADSATKIAEMNEQNNAVSRTIAKTCPVYIKSFEIEVTPSHSTGPYPLPVKLTLRLDVIGQGELEIRRHTINHATSTKKYQFPASGNYAFEVSEMDVIAAWLVPNPQKITCSSEYAICPVIYAWVVGPCADCGQIQSNTVNCRYEQQ